MQLVECLYCVFFFFSSRRRHTRCSRDWSSDVCSSDLPKYASAARLSARRRVLAIGYATGALALWQTETGKELWNSQGHKTATAIREVTFSPDERLLATAGRDNLAKIWDVATGKLVLTLSG